MSDFTSNPYSDTLPQRPRSHVLGDVAVRAVIDCFPDEWTHQEGRPDYGIDLIMEIVQGTDVTGTQFGIQVKGKDASRKGSNVAVRNIKASTINYWKKRSERIMLAAYLSEEDIVVWRWIDDVETPTTERSTLYIPSDQELNDVDWAEFAADLETFYKGTVPHRAAAVRAIPKIPAQPFIQLLSKKKEEGPLDPDCAIDVYEDAAVVHYANNQCGILDCGMRSQNDVLDWLHERSITHLSFVAISHWHLDHYGGLASVLASLDQLEYLFLPPTQLLTSHVTLSMQPSATRRSIGSIARLLGEIKRWHATATKVIQYSSVIQRVMLGYDSSGNEINLDVFSPARRLQNVLMRAAAADYSGKPVDQNSICPIFRLTTDSASFLLPGDASVAVWYEVLTNSLDAIKSDGLVLPHNGSPHSLNPDILRSIMNEGGFPAIVTPLPRFLLPHEDVIIAVKAQGGTIIDCSRRPANVRLRRSGLILE